jgi:hypothetical protein
MILQNGIPLDMIHARKNHYDYKLFQNRLAKHPEQ